MDEGVGVLRRDGQPSVQIKEGQSRPTWSADDAERALAALDWDWDGVSGCGLDGARWARWGQGMRKWTANGLQNGLMEHEKNQLRTVATSSDQGSDQ